MKWQVVYLPEVDKDFKQLGGNQKIQVLKAIDKVSSNPLSIFEGGYGKPLGNKDNTNLSGFLKIKLRDIGIRVVYKLVRTKTHILIIVIGAREDSEVYEIASKRIQKYKL